MRFVAAFVLLVLYATAVQAEWLKSETRHFRIYSEGRVEALRNFSIKVERFDRLLRRRNGISDDDAPQKLTVFMLPTRAAVARAHGGPKDSDVAGFYVPTGEGSMAVVNRVNGDSKYELDADEVLFHEYAHHFMMRYFPVTYPAWYVEGFAEFLATVDFDKEGRAKLGVPPYYRAFGLVLAAPVPIEKLLTTPVDELSVGERDPFYGRSWALVHYLSFTKSRANQLAAYLKALNGGASNAEAIKSAFGDVKQLGKDLQAYLDKSKISYIQELGVTSAIDRVDIAPVPPATGATMAQRIMVMRGIEKDEVDKLEAALNAAIVKYPGEAEPWLLLAIAQFQAGDDVRAQKSADAALAIAPGMSRAMSYKGWAMLRQNVKDHVVEAERWKAARGWIIKANRADINDPVPLYLYFMSFRMQGVTPSVVSRQGLERAYLMVPEDRDIRMTYASQLASEEDFAQAIRLVATLAFDPHNGPGSAEARAYLKQLQAAQDGHETADLDLSGEATENQAGK